MSKRDLVIGLDCSTTACKAVVWDTSGAVVSAGRAPIGMTLPRPGWHEQNAEEWWSASVQALRQAAAQVDTRRLAALCIAVQRETFVLADESGQPHGPALVWMDERCRDLLPEIEQRYSGERFHTETGKPLSANLSIGKLFWINRHQPGWIEHAPLVLDVHAFLTHRLTGRFATSWGCADPMGMLDMREKQWNQPLFQALELSALRFPELIPTGEVAGKISAEAATTCGLPEGLPLAAGIGDGQAASLGVALTNPGDAYLNLGTAVVSGTLSETYLTDRAFRTMTGGLPGTFLLETVLLGGTYTVNWLVDNFAGGDPEALTALDQAASRLPPGAQGLVLVPYWNSVLNPYWDADASGIVVGWRGVHGPAHLYRAVLEGIAMEQRLHTDGVADALRRPVERYIAVGGGARSSIWPQIIADATGRSVVLTEAPEATALGAGMLAAAAVGLFSGPLEAAQRMARASTVIIQPDPVRQAVYQDLYESVYRPLYPALQPVLARLATISETGSSASSPDEREQEIHH